MKCYPGYFLYDTSPTILTPTEKLAKENDLQCMANCDAGRFAFVTWDSARNETLDAKCLDCHTSCFECRGGSDINSCTVCKKG